MRITLAATFFTFLIPFQVLASSFLDVGESHPYSQAIEWGKSSSIIGGYSDGSFKPEKTVNRAEFLKMILEAVQADVSTSVSVTGFTDVDENAWYTPYIRYGKEHGIIKGYDDGTFKPSQPVNYVEALKMAYLALEIDTEDTNEEWYVPYLRHSLYHNILFTSDIDISADIQRKDVIWIVWKLRQLNGDVATIKEEVKEPVDRQPSNMLTSGNLYPVNLLNNQQWKIRITTPVDVLDQQDVFDVTRNEDRFTLVAYELDQKNGGLDKSYTQDYKVRFTQRYNEPYDDFLELYRCWYKYKHIQTGFTCHYIRVPTEIDQRDVFGDDDFDGLITSVSEGFEVEVLAKSKTQIECNVKGELHDNQKIYHTRSSKFYGDLKTGFKCFEAESNAKKAGYKRSVSN